MLPRNEHYQEVRGSYLVPLPDCAKDSKGARGSQRYVLTMSSIATRSFLSGRKNKSNKQAVSRRRQSRADTLLVTNVGNTKAQMYDQSPTSSRVNKTCRSGSNIRVLDYQGSQGVDRINTPLSLGATGTKARIPVRVIRIGTTLLRTRTTTSGLAASVTIPFIRSATTTVSQADLATYGQPNLSSLGKYTVGFSRTQSSETSKGVADISMAKKHRNLIGLIADIDNLRLAFKKTAAAKKLTYGYLQFNEFSEANLLALQKELISGTYKMGGYRQFIVKEPKPRLISALDFKDRLVQHALCNIISPIFEATLLPNTFACRDNMGTHKGVNFIQSKLRHGEYKYFLKTDYSKFFPSVDRDILLKMIERKITCEKTMKIIREILPPTGSGIPIGSLTSQLFANVYGGAVDRFIHFELGYRHWARYMDDIIILGDDLNQLRADFEKIAKFSAEHLKLRISKWNASPTSRGINFLGYRIWPTHKLLRKDSVTRAKRKIARYTSKGMDLELQKFIVSWRGHASHADTCNLFHYLEKKYGDSHQYA